MSVEKSVLVFAYSITPAFANLLRIDWELTEVLIMISDILTTRLRPQILLTSTLRLEILTITMKSIISVRSKILNMWDLKFLTIIVRSEILTVRRSLCWITGNELSWFTDILFTNAGLWPKALHGASTRMRSNVSEQYGGLSSIPGPKKGYLSCISTHHASRLKS